MEHVTFRLEVLTPAFVSGADQESVELRAATVRGHVRWWWRARQDPSADLTELGGREGELFGSARLKLKSLVRFEIEGPGTLRVIPAGTPAPRSNVTYEYQRRGQRGTADILPYLAYGPVRLLTRDDRERYQATRDPRFTDHGRPRRGALFIRPAIAPETKFRVKCSWRPGVLSEEMLEELVGAVSAWVTLGGLGTRARKGFGALAGSVEAASSPDLMESARRWWEAAEREALRTDEAVSRVARYPTLRGRVVHLGPRAETWQEALAGVGLVYKERRPRGDIRWIAGDASQRRASSILLSVIRENGSYRGVLAFLPCDQDGTGRGAQAALQFRDEFLRWQLT